MYCAECGIWLGLDIPSVEIDGEMYCEDCAAEIEEEAAYQRAVMESARAQFNADRPYLRMAREQGVAIHSMADCDRFKEAIAREVD